MKNKLLFLFFFLLSFLTVQSSQAREKSNPKETWECDGFMVYQILYKNGTYSNKEAVRVKRKFENVDLQQKGSNQVRLVGTSDKEESFNLGGSWDTDATTSKRNILRGLITIKLLGQVTRATPKDGEWQEVQPGTKVECWRPGKDQEPNRSNWPSPGAVSSYQSTQTPQPANSSNSTTNSSGWSGGEVYTCPHTITYKLTFKDQSSKTVHKTVEAKDVSGPITTAQSKARELALAYARAHAAREEARLQVIDNKDGECIKK